MFQISADPKYFRVSADCEYFKLSASREYLPKRNLELRERLELLLKKSFLQIKLSNRDLSRAVDHRVHSNKC